MDDEVREQAVNPIPSPRWIEQAARGRPQRNTKPEQTIIQELVEVLAYMATKGLGVL